MEARREARKSVSRCTWTPWHKTGTPRRPRRERCLQAIRDVAKVLHPRQSGEDKGIRVLRAMLRHRAAESSSEGRQGPYSGRGSHAAAAATSHGKKLLATLRTEDDGVEGICGCEESSARGRAHHASSAAHVRAVLHVCEYTPWSLVGGRASACLCVRVRVGACACRCVCVSVRVGGGNGARTEARARRRGTCRRAARPALQSARPQMTQRESARKEEREREREPEREGARARSQTRARPRVRAGASKSKYERARGLCLACERLLTGLED
eukprot:6213990-Pleurochrysis_carterae.AAC.6